MASYALIQTPEELEALARDLRGERVIGVDTEADSFFHYFDKLCLVQIAARNGVWLVDPLALPEKGLAPLAPILADPNVRKVLHAADYDLYVLQRYDGLEVRNIFDTMISAQLLGYPAVGLGALVEKHFGVKLAKDQQRTDWSRRPLRSAQLEYAASDVDYLIPLVRLLEGELRTAKRLEWARQEFALLEKRVWPEREFDHEGYLRIKGARRLPPRGLAVLRELYLMRDRRARDLDRPPFKVLGNGTLLDLATHPPTSRRGLEGRRGITELVMRRFGKELLDAVRRGTEGPEHPPRESRAPQGSRRRLDRKGEARLEQLKRWRARRAAELAMDPGVFCPNAALEEIAGAEPDSVDALRELSSAKGWWVDSFGSEVLAALAAPDEPDPAAPAPRPRRRSRGGRRRSSRKKRARAAP